MKTLSNLTNVLAKIFGFLNKDMSGTTWERTIDHPYFGQVIYFGHKDPSKCYWEAELTALGQKVGITMKGTEAGPEPAEEAFCRSVLAGLDSLFERCRPSFSANYPAWVKDPFPVQWTSAFSLDGFSVPLHGDENAQWEVSYLLKPASRFFTAHFESGRVQRVDVDG